MSTIDKPTVVYVQGMGMATIPAPPTDCKDWWNGQTCWLWGYESFLRGEAAPPEAATVSPGGLEDWFSGWMAAFDSTFGAVPLSYSAAVDSLLDFRSQCNQVTRDLGRGVR